MRAKRAFRSLRAKQVVHRPFTLACCLYISLALPFFVIPCPALPLFCPVALPLFCPALSCLCFGLSCPAFVLPCPALPLFCPAFVLPCLCSALPCPALPYPAFVLPCPALPCPALPYPVLPLFCPTLPCTAITSYDALSSVLHYVSCITTCSLRSHKTTRLFLLH